MEILHHKAICCGDVPWNLGLKKVYIYMVGPELAIDLEDTLLKYMHNIKQWELNNNGSR